MLLKALLGGWGKLTCGSSSQDAKLKMWQPFPRNLWVLRRWMEPNQASFHPWTLCSSTKSKLHSRAVIVSVIRGKIWHQPLMLLMICFELCWEIHQQGVAFSTGKENGMAVKEGTWWHVTHHLALDFIPNFHLKLQKRQKQVNQSYFPSWKAVGASSFPEWLPKLPGIGIITLFPLGSHPEPLTPRE